MKRTKTQNNFLSYKTSKGVLEHPVPIEYYWELKYTHTTSDYLDKLVLPTLFPDIIIPSLGEIYDIERKLKYSESLLSTISVKCKNLRFKTNSQLFGIRIKPTFLTKIVKYKICDLNNGPNNLNEVIIDSFVEHMKGYHSEMSFKEKGSYFNDFFNQNEFSVTNIHEELISKCIHSIISGEVTTVKELAGMTGYSKRWIELKFADLIGISPKKMIFLTRINRFIHLLNTNNEDKLTDLAIKAGYYDQSHLIRDLKNITEYTPKDLRENLATFII